MLWGMLFLNVSAGLGLISQLSPLAQVVVKNETPGITPADLAIAGGTILAIASIFNGLGRLFWASLSDKIGRKMVFMVMFASQAVLYIFLPQISNVMLFTDRRLLPAGLLRRRVRHDAALHGRFFRSRLHREGLRHDAHGLGLRRRRGSLCFCEDSRHALFTWRRVFSPRALSLP